MRFKPGKIALSIAAPVFATVFSLAVSSASLLATNKSPREAFAIMWEFGSGAGSLMEAVNLATSYYIAAIAIALTFRAGLFNIGVEGQLRLGSLFAAYFGAMIALPPVLHIAAIFFIAMFVGGLWAAIAAYMKVKRGVSEVISTIMLNYIASLFVLWLLKTKAFLREERQDPIAPEVNSSALLPKLLGGDLRLHLGIFIALGVTWFVWWLLTRSTLGFKFRVNKR